MSVNLLSNVNVVAISLVNKGANRKTFFLQKCDAADCIVLPAERRIIKDSDGDEWSAVYAVVAEPGWLENPGTSSDDQVTKDRWESADEIRKAAYRFMRNGGLVNKMHESLAPFGQLVENAIALDDFTVNGETIKKGSWYIAIEPTEAGRKSIENGELAAISIEGTGHRELVEKTHAGDLHRRTGPLRHLINFYMKKPHPFRSCVRDNRKRFGPRTEAICAGLKDIALGTHRWRAQFKGKPGFVAKADHEQACVDDCITVWEDHDLTGDDAKIALDAIKAHEKKEASKVSKLLDSIAKAVGVNLDEIDEEQLSDEEIGKRHTFGNYIAERKIEDELPAAMDAFRQSVFRAFYPPSDEEGYDPKQALAQSTDEFKEWIMALLENLPISKREEFAEQAQAELQEATDMGLSKEETDRIEKIESTLSKFGEGQEKLTTALTTLVEKTEKTEPPTFDELQEQMKKLAEGQETIQKGLELLAEGGSAQVKNPDGETVKKKDTPLAGLLA